MMTEPTVLVVDDEVDILELVSFHLERAGFNVLQAKDGETALSILWDENIDLVVLDLMLPGINGLEVLKNLRENKRTESLPVILVTAKTTEVDRIVGFDLGTDDYVCKPFSVKELIARVKALLKRSGSYGGENTFNAQGFSVNFTNHKIFVDMKPVEFSPKEFAILEYLYRNRNAVIGRDQILDKVWGMDTSVDDRVVDVNITRIREKMGVAKKIIRTVKGYGYIFDPDALNKD
ncbi:MAG: response regulator transcription factor [Fibrobacteres bacterium]|nr:response regulator transcription factor [Fibrobacterota bacterium]